MYKVLLKKQAKKQYDRLSDEDKGRILTALKGLRGNPFNGKKLEGELKGFWSVHVWPYRIVYTIEKKIIAVTVVAIGHRKDVYNKLK